LKGKVNIIICDEISQQTNDYDCGVYTIEFFEQLLIQYPLSSNSKAISNRFKVTFNKPDLISVSSTVGKRIYLKNAILTHCTNVKENNSLIMNSATNNKSL
jgi:Ulp1 family protease